MNPHTDFPQVFDSFPGASGNHPRDRHLLFSTTSGPHPRDRHNLWAVSVSDPGRFQFLEELALSIAPGELQSPSFSRNLAPNMGRFEPISFGSSGGPNMLPLVLIAGAAFLLLKGK